MKPNEEMINKLIELARSAHENSYSPYSRFRVGAALLAKNGRIYLGANFENSSFGAGSCAERVALGSAIASGEREFEAICVYADRTVTPCGICRQALSEFGDMAVICTGDDGGRCEYMLSELLPTAFSGDALH